MFCGRKHKGLTMTGWNRCKMAFAGGVIAASVGCSSTPKQPELPIPAAPPPITQVSKSVTIPEPMDDPRSEKTGPLAPATLLVFADTWVESVRNDPAKPVPERERLLTQARQFYNEVLQRDPKNADALIGTARMYQVTGESDRLAETEKRMREAQPNNAKVWAWIAVRQGQSKDWENAVASYQKAVTLDPDNRMYRIQLGFTLARAGRYDEGFTWLNRSMRESEARFNLAMMMAHNQRPELAREQLTLTLRIDPSFRQASEQLAVLDGGGDNQAFPAPTPDTAIRSVGYEEPTAPARPMPAPAPQKMNQDPLPLRSGNGSAGNLPPAYTATTGWDTTIPPGTRR